MVDSSMLVRDQKLARDLAGGEERTTAPKVLPTPESDTRLAGPYSDSHKMDVVRVATAATPGGLDQMEIRRSFTAEKTREAVATVVAMTIKSRRDDRAIDKLVAVVQVNRRVFPTTKEASKGGGLIGVVRERSDI
jgi:hypothetical protein